MKINRFEDLEVWQKARELVKLVYSITGNSMFSKDYSLKDQMRRAAVSIMSNIAEGFSRRTRSEFRQYSFIAKGSIAELQSQLYVAIDQKYISDSEFHKSYQGADEIARMLSGLITYLSKPPGRTESTQRTK